MNRLKKEPQCINCVCDFDFLFKSLHEKELLKLADHKHTRTYQKGEILFYEAMEPFGVYCIASGLVKLYKTDTNGKQTILRIAKKGTLLELRAVLSNQNNSSTGEVLSEGEVCFIDRNTIYALVQRNASLSSDIMKNLCEQISVYEDKIHSLAKDSVRERLARLLLDLKKNFNNKMKRETSSIEVDLSREEMAQLIGTATETLIRFLSEFKSDKLIAVDGRRIDILDEQKLNALAGNLPMLY